jgi:hypothetical protein
MKTAGSPYLNGRIEAVAAMVINEIGRVRMNVKKYAKPQNEFQGQASQNMLQATTAN